MAPHRELIRNLIFGKSAEATLFASFVLNEQPFKIGVW